MTSPQLRPAAAADWPRIRDLLIDAGLPTSDLGAGRTADFLVAVDAANGVVGCVALEPLGDCGLLRSLVVDAACRGGGLAARLVDAVVAKARRESVGELWLLTIDAADYFARLGFVRAPREHAPESVRSTPEFSSLCPGSAQLMRFGID
ncbi:MAG: arsenic resistance N-acetyltransferase ArsN2 [Woeseiaceae bacterium]|nr:arsenic resistance N-acetyltransferase ArsN2 [Woeseiaceae bacterium]